MSQLIGLDDNACWTSELLLNVGHCFADDCRKTDDDLNDLFKHVKQYKPYQLIYSLCLILCLPLAIGDAHGTRRTRGSGICLYNVCEYLFVFFTCPLAQVRKSN